MMSHFNIISLPQRIALDQTYAMLKRIYFLIISEFFIANKICERLYRDFFNIVGIVEKKNSVCVCVCVWWVEVGVGRGGYLG